MKENKNTTSSFFALVMFGWAWGCSLNKRGTPTHTHIFTSFIYHSRFTLLQHFQRSWQVFLKLRCKRTWEKLPKVKNQMECSWSFRVSSSNKILFFFLHQCIITWEFLCSFLVSSTNKILFFSLTSAYYQFTK